MNSHGISEMEGCGKEQATIWETSKNRIKVAIWWVDSCTRLSRSSEHRALTNNSILKGVRFSGAQSLIILELAALTDIYIYINTTTMYNIKPMLHVVQVIEIVVYFIGEQCVFLVAHSYHLQTDRSCLLLGPPCDGISTVPCTICM